MFHHGNDDDDDDFNEMVFVVEIIVAITKEDCAILKSVGVKAYRTSALETSSLSRVWLFLIEKVFIKQLIGLIFTNFKAK